LNWERESGEGVMKVEEGEEKRQDGGQWWNREGKAEGWDESEREEKL